MRIVDWIAFILMILAGLNWGWIALTGYNPFGGLVNLTDFSRVIYALFGLSGIWAMISAFVKLNQCAYYQVGAPITRSRV
jgi:uncharacterized membrane protein YuzA (DUF378 family)